LSRASPPGPRGSPELALGVDLGGTKIEAVVVRLAPFAELARVRVPTERDQGYEAIVARTADTIRRVARDADFDLEAGAIGVGMPGSVTRRGGLVKNSNTVCLNGRPFREDLTHAVGQPIAFENDANCFALAETVLGAAAPYRDGVVFGVILGTGVGGGLVIRGEVWEGTQGLGGEWGHHGVWAGRDDARPCYCGQRGCVEQYLSGRAAEADYERRAGRRLGLPAIAERRGIDPDAAAAIDSLLESFGRAVANVVDILDPSVIVLGGGVSNLELLLTEGIPRVAAAVFNDELLTPIVKHAIGDSAGVLGAALCGDAARRKRDGRPARSGAALPRRE
jgi:fructokinase